MRRQKVNYHLSKNAMHALSNKDYNALMTCIEMVCDTSISQRSLQFVNAKRKLSIIGKKMKRNSNKSKITKLWNLQ